MAKYEIVSPCAYPVKGRIVRQRKPGAIVELDDATVRMLGDKVKPVGAQQVDYDPVTAPTQSQGWQLPTHPAQAEAHGG